MDAGAACGGWAWCADGHGARPRQLEKLLATMPAKPVNPEDNAEMRRQFTASFRTLKDRTADWRTKVGTAARCRAPPLAMC